MDVQAISHNLATQAALQIYSKVLEAVEGGKLVRAALRRTADELDVQGQRIDLASFDRILLCAVGKASEAMAKAAIEVVGDVDGGVVVTRRDTNEEVPAGLRSIEAGHPYPDEGSLLAGEAILQLASSVDEGTLVLFLLSGGASAMLESPAEGVSLEDLRSTNDFLLGSGQPIQVVNSVRSRTSRTKAGGLARAFAPATVLVLVLSDVLGNDLATIGSGPFLEPRPGVDASIRFAHAPALPDSVRAALQAPKGIELGPTATVRHFVIGSVSLAMHEALSAAEELGLEGLGYSDPMVGEAREMARSIARHARTVLEHRSGQPFCMVFGGETTVKLGSVHGLGGRCQEMALAIAPRLVRMPGCAFLAAGTDGSDGPTDAAGATADPDTVSRAEAKGLKASEALANHDSYGFLSATGNLIVTGPTGSNVNDIALFVSA
jgi:glycerate-2-kinase